NQLIERLVIAKVTHLIVQPGTEKPTGVRRVLTLFKIDPPTFGDIEGVRDQRAKTSQIAFIAAPQIGVVRHYQNRSCARIFREGVKFEIQRTTAITSTR